MTGEELQRRIPAGFHPNNARAALPRAEIMFRRGRIARVSADPLRKTDSRLENTTEEEQPAAANDQFPSRSTNATGAFSGWACVHGFNLPRPVPAHIARTAETVSVDLRRWRSARRT